MFDFCLCIFLISRFSINASPILDQQVEGSDGLELVIPGAQTFTVGIAGYLSRLDLDLSGRRGEERSYAIGVSRESIDGRPLDDYDSHFLFYEDGRFLICHFPVFLISVYPSW